MNEHSSEGLEPRVVALVEQAVHATLRALDDQPLPIRKEWLTPKEAADYLRLHPAHLAKLRSKGGGPVFHAVGPRLVRYHVANLSQWIREGGTSEQKTCSEK